MFSNFNLECTKFDRLTVPIVFAKMEKSTYAKALVGCTLYKSASLSDDLENIYFIVPETYFVTVLENLSDTVMKVQYDKFIGYVNSSTVLIATFIPIVKTLDGVTFDIKETAGTQVWNLPSATAGNSLIVISNGTKNIKYIAMTYGTIPSGGESNLWYYVSYTPAEGSTNVYEGYVYSENVTNLSEIVLNAESNPEVISNEIDANAKDTIYISSSVKTVIIALIAVPIILLVAILLYKLVKKIQSGQIKRKNVQKEVSEVFETENYEPYGESEQSSNYANNYPLRNKLNEMKKTTYVKKQHNYGDYNENSKPYPDFPTYDSEDDLLWMPFSLSCSHFAK